MYVREPIYDVATQLTDLQVENSDHPSGFDQVCGHKSIANLTSISCFRPISMYVREPIYDVATQLTNLQVENSDHPSHQDLTKFADTNR